MRRAEIDEHRLRTRYLDDGINPYQLAEEFGVCRATLYKRLVGLGIFKDRRPIKYEDIGDQRKCAKCGELKPKTEYTKSAKRKNSDGLRTVCRGCTRKDTYEGYWRQPERRIEKTMEWYRRRRDAPTLDYMRRSLWTGVRARVREKHGGIMHFSKPEFFAWLDTNGLEALLTGYIAAGLGRWDRPSVDRLDNSRGYSFDNMRLVTWRENARAWTSSQEAKLHGRNQIHFTRPKA